MFITSPDRMVDYDDTCLFGVFPKHRQTSSGTRPIEEATHHDSAGSMDPQSLVAALRGLWELSIDVVMLVHDNDTTAIKRLREAKQALLKAHPDANMSKCACEGGGHIVDAKFKHGTKTITQAVEKKCNNGDVCCGVATCAAPRTTRRARARETTTRNTCRRCARRRPRCASTTLPWR